MLALLDSERIVGYAETAPLPANFGAFSLLISSQSSRLAGIAIGLTIVIGSMAFVPSRRSPLNAAEARS